MIATTQRTYLFDCCDTKVSKEILCEHLILLIIYLRKISIIRFKNITNSRNRLFGFLFSSDIEMALFSDRKTYCISHFMEGQILFSQVGFFFTSVKDCHQGNYKNVK